jgi:hypothetical protein
VKDLIAKLLGGRPMTFVCACFTDVCDGKKVNRYVDYYGRPWLATSRWSLFRVTPIHGVEIWK